MRSRVAICLALVMLLLGQSAHAANTQNTNSSASGSITSTSNWSLGHVPTVSEDAVFTSSPGGGIRNFNTGTVTFGSLDVTATSGTFTIRNESTTGGATSTLTLGGAGDLGNSTTGANSSDLIYVNTGAILNLTATGGSGAVGVMSISLGQSGNFDILGTSTITAAISGSGFGINKTGAGTLTLSGANTYTGLTDVQVGTLAYGASDVISNSASVKISGGTLDIKTFNDTVAGVQLTSGIITGTTGVLTSTSAFDVQSGTVSAILGGSVGLNKTTGGTVTLSKVNTYTGLTDVQAGTLEYGASDVIANGASVKVSGGTLDIKTFTDTVAGVQLTSGTIAGTTGVLTSTSTFDVQAGSASAILAGSVGLTKTTGGTVTLSGANAYTGTTTISEGTLSAGSIVVSGSASNLGNASSAVVLGGASTTGTLSYTGAAATYVRGFTVDAGGGGLTNAGTGLLQLSTVGTTIASGGTLTFATNANGIQVNSSSVISGDGAVTLNSAGAGALELQGANTFLGGFTLTSGTVNIGAANALSTGTLRINGGTLQGNSGTARAVGVTQINVGGDFTIGGANTGALSFSAPIDLGGATRQITDDNTTNNTTFSGVISNGGLTKLGNGQLNLTGTSANTYTGLTTVSAGTLGLGKSASTNAFGGDLTINGGTVLYSAANDNQIADSAKVTISSGSLDFGARNETIGSSGTSGLALSGTGAITMSGGTIHIANSMSMTGGTVTVQGAGNFQADTEFNFSGGTIDFSSGAGALNLRAGTGTGITYSSSGTATAQITNSGGTGSVSLNTAAGATTVFNIADAASVATEMSIAAPITGAGKNLQKTGTGVLTLGGTNTYTGTTAVNGGSLFVNGSTIAASAVTVTNSGSTLGGSGTINGTVNVASAGANLSPGASGVGSVGKLNTGALTLAASSNFNVDLNAGAGATGAGPGTNYDQVSVTGGTIFSGAGPNLKITAASNLAVGDTFFILLNNLGSTTAGTFNGLANGSSVTAINNGDTFLISYLATGDTSPGNDISLTLTAVPEPSTWGAAALALSVMCYSQKKRLTRKAKTLKS